MPRFRARIAGDGASAPPVMERPPVVQPIVKRVSSQNDATPLSMPQTDDEITLVARVQSRLLNQFDMRFEAETRDVERLQRHISHAVDAVLEEDNIVLPESERQRIQRKVRAEVTGYGPLEDLLDDETVSEIMVNSPTELYVERAGTLHESAIRFNDEAHLRRVIDRIVAPLGRRVNESSPMVDARLPDGSRVNIVIQPIALKGATLTIRKFASKPLTPEDLVQRGAVTAEVMEFLRICVLGRMNVVVTGGTGAGKTTLLNVLSRFIPDNERIITIENAAELQLQQRHVVTLESRPANIEGKGEISIRDLVVNALRMRPNRIVVGECRSGETLDML
ncbi:MAG: Type II/IV secretion system ATP hydrolase TadA/VirB11/CpaF, TadA subfamily, partial [uncultured Chloroflexia bacterium]